MPCESDDPTPRREPPSVFVLACDVLQDEVEHLAAGMRHLVRREYLPMGLHDRPAHMRTELQGWIEVAEADPRIETIVLVYGLCGHGTVGLEVRRVPLVIPRAHDCITLFLGSASHYARFYADHPDAYFYTPGWMRGGRVPGPERQAALRRDLEARYADSERVARLLEAEAACWEGRHHATYIDHGLPQHDGCAETARACAEGFGWSFEQIAGDPTLLKKTLAGNWSEKTHLIVQPGQSIRPSYDDTIMRTAAAKSRETAAAASDYRNRPGPKSAS